MKKKMILAGVMLILFCAVVNALVDGDYIQVRDSSDWNTISENSMFLNQIPDPAEPGKYVEVRIKVENIGLDHAKNMIFKVDPEFPFSLDPGDNGIINLGDVEARQIGEDAYVLYWKLKVDEQAVEGNNKLSIKYSQNGGKTWSELDNYYLRVQTHDSIISVEKVTSIPENIKPGEKFILNITLKNMADSVLKDLKVKLQLIYVSGASSIELPFTPFGSTNEKVIKMIDAGKTATLSFEMVADTGANSGIYKIPLSIQYSDELAKNYTYNGIIGAIIGNKPDLFINSDMSELTKTKTNVPITIKFVNRGKEDIKFLFAEIGDIDGMEFVTSKENYIGNIDSDDYETQDYTVNVDNCDKKYNIPVHVIYSDTNNKQYDENYNLETKICSSMTAEENQSNKYVGIIVVIVIIVIALILYRIYKKRQ